MMWLVDWDGHGGPIETPTEHAAKLLVEHKRQAGIKRVTYWEIEYTGETA